MNSNARGPYIAIEGVIGVGKTTLARLLQPRFQSDLILEAFDENPFLSDFYGDRTRYAFQTQIFFLLSRYRQQQMLQAKLGHKAMFSDYCFEKDKLFAHLNIVGEDELAMYDRLYEALSEKVPQPDLLVYLRAEVDTLMGRIAMRDRSYERQMDRGYIAALRQGYEMLFSTYRDRPLLIIDTDDMDFVRHPQHLDEIEGRIRTALAGVQQPTLPEIAPPLPPRFSWKLPVTPTPEPRSEANWQALGDFLALAEAVGRIGGSLSQSPPIGPDGGASEPICGALRDAYGALNALARRVNLEIEPRAGNVSASPKEG